MNNIAIYGAGGLGREVALMIHQINSHNPDPWKIVGFYDDAKVGEPRSMIMLSWVASMT